MTIPLKQSSKGQTEMIGLVFIVAIVVIGMIIYIISLGKQDSGTSNRDLLQAQLSPTYLTAIDSTSVPSCNNISFEKVVQKCIKSETFCTNGDPCAALSLFLDNITQNTLFAQGSKYNLSIEGRSISSVYECDSANSSVKTYAGSHYAVNLGDGAQVNLRLFLCR